MFKMDEREELWAMVLLAARVERVGRRLNILYRSATTARLRVTQPITMLPTARANSIYPPVYLSDPITQPN